MEFWASRITPSASFPFLTTTATQINIPISISLPMAYNSLSPKTKNMPIHHHPLQPLLIRKPKGTMGLTTSTPTAPQPPSPPPKPPPHHPSLVALTNASALLRRAHLPKEAANFTSLAEEILSLSKVPKRHEVNIPRPSNPAGDLALAEWWLEQAASGLREESLGGNVHADFQLELREYVHRREEIGGGYSWPALLERMERENAHSPSSSIGQSSQVK